LPRRFGKAVARNRYGTGRRPALKLLIGRHLLGGGHPVLRQHGRRQPVSAARVHADHHGSARFPSGAAPS
jgi:hypothetical protein